MSKQSIRSLEQSVKQRVEETLTLAEQKNTQPIQTSEKIREIIRELKGKHRRKRVQYIQTLIDLSAKEYTGNFMRAEDYIRTVLNNIQLVPENLREPFIIDLIEFCMTPKNTYKLKDGQSIACIRRAAGLLGAEYESTNTEFWGRVEHFFQAPPPYKHPSLGISTIQQHP